MVFGVQGPKSILSTAIAKALEEFFVVDARQIESNLLKNTKIVLHDVQLRKQVTRLPTNSAGKPTLITVTGSVKEVAFTWIWAVGSNKDEQHADAWVRDSKLALKGLEFKAKLEYGTGDEELTPLPASPEEHMSLDDKQAAAVQQQGGFQAWITKQVEMIIDSLELHVEDFEFTVEIPPPLERPASLEYCREASSLVMAGSRVKMLSSGRQPDGTSSTSSETAPTVIQQNLSLESLTINVIKTTSTGEADAATVHKTSLPILEPFSYSADLTRSSGKRFSGIATGIIFIGKTNATTGLAVHFGTQQIETLTQLGIMILAPPDSSEKADKTQKHRSNDNDKKTFDYENTLASAGDQGETQKELDATDQADAMVSVFVLPMKSVSLVMDGTGRVTFPLISVSYKADGTVMEVTASGCRMESIPPDGSKDKGPGHLVAISGITLNLRPQLDLMINEVNEVYVPKVIRLTKPIENSRISYQGETLSINVESIEAEVPREDVESQEEQAADASLAGSSPDIASDTAGKNVSSDHEKRQDDKKDESVLGVAVPFPLALGIGDIILKSGTNYTKAQDLNVYANPNHTDNSTDVAVRLKEFRSELIQFTEINVFATLPLDEPNEIQSFAFSASSGRFSAGYSTEEWKESLEPKPLAKKSQAKSKSKSIIVKFPNASVSALNVKIAWKGKGVKIKDTDVFIKPFSGDATTTSKDLIEYYVGACLSRVPGFISNADVLGINVVDHTASTYGMWLGQGLFGTFVGAAGGVAAIAAVDGVKGAVRAGKQSRSAENGVRWRPGDAIRGVVYSAGQATKTGALKRGKGNERGSVVAGLADFVVGTTTETGGYVSENKVKLGAASAAGVGMVTGTMVAGPVGGIVGGLLASAVTGKTIESAEERARKSKRKKKLQATKK